MVTIFGIGPNLEDSVEKLHEEALILGEDPKGFVNSQQLTQQFLEKYPMEWDFYLTDDAWDVPNKIPILTKEGNIGTKSIYFLDNKQHEEAYRNRQQDNDWQFAGQDRLRGFQVQVDGKKGIVHYVHRSSKPFEALHNNPVRKAKVLYKTFHNQLQYQHNKVVMEEAISQQIKKQARNKPNEAFQALTKELDDHNRINSLLKGPITRVYGNYLRAGETFDWDFSAHKKKQLE